MGRKAVDPIIQDTYREREGAFPGVSGLGSNILFPDTVRLTSVQIFI